MPAAPLPLGPLHLDGRSDCHDLCLDCQHESHQPKLLALTPKVIEPTQTINRSPRPTDILKSIEWLEVTKMDERTDRHVYAIDIYYHDTQSHIPIHRHPGRSSIEPSKPLHAKPSATIQVAYDDLLQFRYDAYELARSSHLLDGCRFCHPVMYLNAGSHVKPRWNSHWFKADNEVAAMLTTYLNAMLRVMDRISPNVESHCYGQRLIPELLQSFLRTHGHEE